MKNITFEYCSLHYLNWWLSHDMGYCQALDKGDEVEKFAALKQVATHYSIARNLPTAFDVNKGFTRYEPILKIIDSPNLALFKSGDLVKEIIDTSKLISNEYGGDNKLSLTTKFLWMKFKHPILIYDQRARNFLNTSDGDLDGYYKKWHAEFEAHQKEIVAACSKLPSLHKYAVDQEIGTKEYIDQISSKPWFHERVFDTYLWHRGA